MEKKHCMYIKFSKYWQKFKEKLFPEPELFLGSTTESHLELMFILDTIMVSDFLSDYDSCLGRGCSSLDRECFGKLVLNLATTVALIDRLKVDIILRRICGVVNKNKLPCEASFSNL